jgi:4-hydroxy-3-polyprenylbenzoate decarboxylase
LPEIRDFWMPWEGVFHNITVVSIEKEYPGHARRVMSALWGQGQMSFCKVLVVMDAKVDLTRSQTVIETLLDEVDLESDLYVSEGVLDVLDHSAPEPLFGAKLGIDATRRLPNEKDRPRLGEPLPLPSREHVDQALHEISPLLTASYAPPLNVRNRLLLINFRKDGTSSGADLAGRLLNHELLATFSILILYDASMDLRDASLVLWKVFNNVDPRRDIVKKEKRAVIDATKKGPEDGHLRPWPDDIVMDPAVVDRVERRAGELGITGSAEKKFHQRS